MGKRVLIVISEYNTGGINRSLQSFLNLIDNSMLDVAIYAIINQGPFKDQLKNCTFISSNPLFRFLFAHLDKASGISKMAAMILKGLNKLSGGSLQRWLFNIEYNRLYPEEYDSIIAFSEGLPTFFVSSIKNDNRIAWIHCNYKSYFQNNNHSDEIKIYESFCHIINVSEYTNACFLSIYPSLKEKSICIYNALDINLIQSSSKELPPVSFDKDIINIVSVGRLDPIKRMSIIPQLASELIHAGLKFRWYIIGPKGNQVEEYNLLVKNIQSFHVQEVVLLLGEQSNPYKFIRQADLLVNVSVSEACPFVINEAKVLGVPVVCTDFGSAHEFVKEGIDGCVRPIEEMAEVLIELLRNRDSLLKLADNLKDFQYDNKSIIESITYLV